MSFKCRGREGTANVQLGDYFRNHANADAFTFAPNHKKQLATLKNNNKNNNKKELLQKGALAEEMAL